MWLDQDCSHLWDDPCAKIQIPVQLREFLCICDIMVHKIEVGNLPEHVFVTSYTSQNWCYGIGYFELSCRFIYGISSALVVSSLCETLLVSSKPKLWLAPRPLVILLFVSVVFSLLQTILQLSVVPFVSYEWFLDLALRLLVGHYSSIMMSQLCPPIHFGSLYFLLLACNNGLDSMTSCYFCAFEPIVPVSSRLN
jgi:hypothetical protein